MTAWMDPTHKRAFTYYSFDYSENDRYAYYFKKAKFRTVRKKLKWSYISPNPVEPFERPKANILLRVLSAFIQFFVNLSPYLCERLWCYWVGGMQELYIELEVVK